MTGIYRPRVKAFRDLMIKDLPRAPNNKASRTALEAMPTCRLVQVAHWSSEIRPFVIGVSERLCRAKSNRGDLPRPLD